MAMHKLGLREPDYVQTSGEHAFYDDGMHYELYIDPGDNNRLYVAADHEDVGQVTWLELDGPEDWSDLCSEAEEIIS